MKIPFVDLKAQYRSIQKEIDQAIREVLEECAFIMGPRKEVFERDFSAFCQARHCVGVGSGSDALLLALKALGVGPGDEVITVSHTFIATVEAISMAGATPRFIDVDPDSLLMNPALIESAVTPRTKAIIPVHLYGQICDMDRILQIAEKLGIRVLEDAAQAHAAELRGRRSPICPVAAFSFYPGKNLGAYGDAGAVVTRDSSIFDRVTRLHDHGRPTGYKYEHPSLGFGHRLDTLQATILRVKLGHLEEWTEARRRHAAHYNRRLTEVVSVPPELPERRHVYHVYAIRTDRRTELQKHLLAAGVSTNIHYPIPVHLQPCYQFLNVARGSLPVTEKCVDQLLSLPMFPELTEAQVDFICDRVLEFFQK